jgi:hypothetical protein
MIFPLLDLLEDMQKEVCERMHPVALFMLSLTSKDMHARHRRTNLIYAPVHTDPALFWSTIIPTTRVLSGPQCDLLVTCLRHQWQGICQFLYQECGWELHASSLYSVFVGLVSTGAIKALDGFALVEVLPDQLLVRRDDAITGVTASQLAFAMGLSGDEETVRHVHRRYARILPQLGIFGSEFVMGLVENNHATMLARLPLAEDGYMPWRAFAPREVGHALVNQEDTSCFEAYLQVQGSRCRGLIETLTSCAPDEIHSRDHQLRLYDLLIQYAPSQINIYTFMHDFMDPRISPETLSLILEVLNKAPTPVPKGADSLDDFKHCVQNEMGHPRLHLWYDAIKHLLPETHCTWYEDEMQRRGFT